MLIPLIHPLGVIDRVDKEPGVDGKHEEFPPADKANKRCEDSELREFVFHVLSLEVPSKLGP